MSATQHLLTGYHVVFVTYIQMFFMSELIMGRAFFISVACVISFTALKEMEGRKENTLLAEKTKIEMDQKIEEVAAKIFALERNCAVLNGGIKQKTAKKESLLSGIMQVYLVAPGFCSD